MFSLYPLLSGIGFAVSLITPLGILVGLYFLARIVRALERIADQNDRIRH